MKLYQLMDNTDGYYGPWVVDNRVFTSRESCEAHYKIVAGEVQKRWGWKTIDPLVSEDSGKTGYYIKELTIIEG